MLRSWWSLVAACALAVSACRGTSGPPDPNYEKASQLYQQLFAKELDEAYGDPQMEQVVTLLKKVDSHSVDAPAAEALLTAIQQGRENLKKSHAEGKKMSEAAEKITVTPPAIDPSKVLGTDKPPDAGPASDPYGPGASIAEINTATGGCLISGEPFTESVTEKSGTLYRLSASPACAEKLPGFVGQVVMASEGRIYRRILESQVPKPPPAATPDAGAPAAPRPAARPAPAASGGDDGGQPQGIIYTPGAPVPPGMTPYGGQQPDAGG
jgi:hypothetical protein